MILKFINRKKELKLLKSAYSSKQAQLLILYGRRRIGKTELIKKSLEEKNHFYFLAKQQKLDLELERFRFKLSKKLDIRLEVDNWSDLFETLATKIKSQYVIVIDEFPYWIQKDKSIVSEFQYIWDEILKSSKISIVILGSYMSIMESQVLGLKSPLYGRRTGQLQVQPLHIKHLSSFFPKYTIEDIIRAYGCIDTIPYYCAQFNEKKSLWHNIKNTFFNKLHPLSQDAEIILNSELREPTIYFNIIKAILDGSTKLSEIAHKARVDVTNMPKYLKNLIHLNIIKKIKPVTISTSERNYRYDLKDNYFRFWLTYIYPFREEIEDALEEHIQYVKKDHTHYMGPVFEAFCREMIRSLKIGKYTKIGSWWHKEEEIDIVGIDEINNTCLFGECKWSHKVDAKRVYSSLKKKAKLVRWKNNTRKETYVIFAKSFSKTVEDKNVFCFDLNDLKKYYELSNLDK